MQDKRPNHTWVLVLAGTLIGIATTAVIYSPTLYQMFCNLTGYGGTVQRAAQPQAAAKSDRTVTVKFDANTASNLPWEFRPEQAEVTTHIGEPTKVYYYAKNNSDETQVARATFNVTPYQTASYFFKIQCFCFTNEKLKPGESARMPLVFYVDEQMLKDDDARGIKQITLSYTFFKQSDLSDDEVAQARNLKTGSESTEKRLQTAKTVGFENDAPRD